ncbi:MAG: glycosyltransferase family protein [Desulfuromonadaceae bacterium]
MNTSDSPTVWLSYAGCPIATVAYFERALRELCTTVTVGPPMPRELVEQWQLQNMKQAPTRPDIVTDFTPDMGAVIQQYADKPRPDLYLWVESVADHVPSNLHALGCPTACYLINSHLDLEHHLEVALGFDYVFIAQRAHLDAFRKMAPRTFWLPAACDPEVHLRWQGDKRYDVGFVGSVSHGSKREVLLNRLNEAIPVHYERSFRDERAKVFSESRLVFNNADNDDLNIRFFEVLSTGTMLLSDAAPGSGQSELFYDGEDYACYRENNLVETACFYLENDELRERIAGRGQRLVRNAHTYRHRIEDLLAVTCAGKPDTFSAAELRERSLAGLSEPIEELRSRIEINSPARSFVIPVLDYSPASEYNIVSLLNDLESIDGEVIVVFNGSAIGEELKRHPRITRHAIMKQNVGVARGWNVGFDMAEGKSVFIVNADAHISSDAVVTIEQGLMTLPGAVCVGPQGAFYNFSLCTDYCYFDKGSFNQAMEVDAVSGFFFAVSRRLFSENGLQFESAYSPCFFEEWDLGLQAKRVGLKCYIVPTEAYDHHWSGTIRALRTIPYLGREEEIGDILKRNRQLFLAKWRSIARKEQNPQLLESGWKRYMLTFVRKCMATGRYAQAKEAIQQLSKVYLDDFEVASLHKLVSLV